MRSKVNYSNLYILSFSVFVVAMILVTVSIPAFAHEKKDKNNQTTSNKKFTFALWGDMPYAKNNDSVQVAKVIKSINESKVDFTIYDGDTKDGSSECTDALIGDSAKELLNSIAMPTVYVVGDNEWTDCHRKNNGGYDALERLNYLRQTMFISESSFGKKTMKLEHQGAPGNPYSENTRWFREGVMFVGLNVPGSKNNKVNEGDCINVKSARTEENCAADNAEYEERNAKNIDWLTESFELAKRNKAAGLMMVIQGDPGFDLPETEKNDERTQPEYSGYTAFLDAIVEQTKTFQGQVVLVHGDTHFFKIDKPLLSPTNVLPNFTRVETFGSPNIHWIKVRVDAKRPNVFEFEPVMIEKN